MLFLAKNYNYMFEFVKVIPKVLSLPFFPEWPKKLSLY